MEKELQNEIEALIDIKIEAARTEITAEITEAVKQVKGGKGLSDKEVSVIVNEKLAGFKQELAGGLNLSKLKKDEDFDPKDKYEDKDTVTLMPTKENPFHPQGKEYTAKGSMATEQIRKGYATFVKAEKFVDKPVNTPKV